MLIICPIAGAGTRLFPLTISKPKSLIKLCGRPVISFIFDKIKEILEPHSKILFIVGHMKEKLRKYLEKEFVEFPIEIREQKPLEIKDDIPVFSGLGDAILLARDLGENEDCFIVLGDRYPLESYKPMIEKVRKNQWDGVINVKRVEKPQHYGVVSLDEKGFIHQIVEKPSDPPSDLAVSGAYYFSKSITRRMFELLYQQSLRSSSFQSEHAFTPIIRQLIDEGARIGIHVMEKDVLDFGRRDSLIDALTTLLQDPSLYNRNVNRINQLGATPSVIVEPVWIGKDVIIEESIIGPYVSVGDGSKIRKAIISHSVIGEKCSLQHVILSHSLIGDFVSLSELINNGISIGDSSSLGSFNRNE